MGWDGFKSSVHEAACQLVVLLRPIFGHNVTHPQLSIHMYCCTGNRLVCVSDIMDASVAEYAMSVCTVVPLGTQGLCSSGNTVEGCVGVL